MDPDLPKDQKLVPIREAAAILGVSIDTIRRWDKNGTLHSQRPDGKNRFFSVAELEKVKFSQPLSISEVSKKLGLSNTTLRRLETKGLIKPHRNGNGERQYDQKSLENFLKSEYWLQNKEVEQEISSSQPEENTSEPINETKTKIQTAVLREHDKEISDLNSFRRFFTIARAVIVIGTITITSLITLLFLYYPEPTARFFGYMPYPQETQLTKVLGAKFPVEAAKPKPPTLGTLLKPFTVVPLYIVGKVNPSLHERILANTKLENVNEIFTIDNEGNVTPKFTLSIPSSTHLQLGDQGLVKNLNAEFVQGYTPGDKPGNLAVLGEDNTIVGLNISSGSVEDGSITGVKLADETVTADKIAPDSLNFSTFANSLSVDENTVINTGAKTLSFRGNVDFNSLAINTLNLQNPLSCSSCLTLTNLATDSVNSAKVVDNSLTGTDLASDTLDFSEFKDSLTIDSTSVINNAGNTLAFRGSAEYVFDSANITNLTVTSCTGCGGGVSADSLNFTDFSDSLSLDANTVLSNSSFTLSFRGAQNYVFDSASISTVTIANPLIGTGIINSSNIVDGTILAADHSADSLNFTELTDSLTLDANTVISNSSFTLSFRGTQNYTFDSVSINTLSVTNCAGCSGGGVGVDSLDFTDLKDSLVLDDNAVLSSSNFTLSFRGANAVVFDSANIATLTLTNGLVGTGVVSTSNILDGTITNSDIASGTILASNLSSDSLNFTELADSLTLDANVVISNSSFTMTFRGSQNYVFDSSSITTLTLTNQLVGTGVITGTNILNETVTASDISADSVGSSELIATGVTAATYGDSSSYTVFTVDGDGRLTSAGTIAISGLTGSAISTDALDFTELKDSLTLDANTVISNSSFTLSFRGAQNYVFDSASVSTLTISNGLIGTGVISGTNISDGTITNSDIASGTILASTVSADALDFTELKDSLTLDSHAVINSSSFTLSFRGGNAVVFDSASISTLTTSNQIIGTGIINSNNIVDGTIISTDISADALDFSTLADSTTLDSNTVISNSSFTLSFRGAQNYVFDSASISTLTISNGLVGTGVISSTNISDGTITNSDISSGTILSSNISADSFDFTEMKDSLVLDTHTVLSSSSFTLSFRGNSVVFDSASISTLTLTNGLVGTNVISGTNISDSTITNSDISSGTILASNVSSDTLDFTALADSLTLDSNSVVSNSSFTLSFRGAQNYVFDSASISTLTISNGLIGTGVISSTNITDGTIQSGDVSADSFDFTELKDSLTLDSNTVLSNSSFTLSFRGAQNYVFDSSSISTLTITNGLIGTNVISGTNITDSTITNSDIASGTILASNLSADTLDFTALADSLTLDANNVISNSSFTLSFRGAQNYVFDSASVATLTISNGLIGTGIVSGTNVSDGTITSSDISADTFNFTQLADSLNLDAHTVISSSDFTLSFRGNAVVFDSATITKLTVTDCTGCTSITADSLNFTDLSDSLVLDANTVISNSSFTLTFRGAQNYGFDSASVSTLSISNGLIGTGVISGNNITDSTITNSDIATGTILSSNVSADSFDFTELKDSQTLDANTVISNSSFTLSFRGAQNYVFDSGSISTLTISNGLIGTGVISGTNISDGTITNSDISSGTILASNISADSFDFAQLADSLTLDANTVVSNSSFTMSFRGAQNYVFDSASISQLTVTSCTGCTGTPAADSLDFTEFTDSMVLDANTIISNSSFTLSFRGAQNYVFDSASVSTLTISNGLIGTNVISGTNITDSTITNSDIASGTILASNISADSFDFTEVKDSITLDANTVFSNSSFTVSFRGAQNYVFDSASVATLTITNGLIGTNVISGTNITDSTITNADIASGTILASNISADSFDFTSLADSLTLDANNVISNSSFTLSFRGSQNYVFDSASVSTLTISNGLIGTNVISGTNISDGTITNSDISSGTILGSNVSSDSFDFTEFKDSQTLDANTVISNSSFTLTFRGAQNFVFDSASIATLALTNQLIGTGIINSTNILNNTIVGGDVAGDTFDFTELNDSLTLDANAVISNSSFTLSFRGAQNYVFDSASVSTLTLTNQLIGTGVINSGNIVNGTVVGGDVSADTFNFTELTDSLALDAHTVISSSDFTLSFRGTAVVFDSATITKLTVTDCTGCGTSITADSLNFTDLSDSLVLDANTVISNSSFTLTFRGAQNYVFDSASVSTLTISNGLIGTGVISSTNILDNTITSSDVSADSFDFTQLADSLTLDANTVISSSDFTLSFRGANAVVFDSANVSTLTLTNVLNGTGVINSTNILNGTVLAGDISADSFNFTELADSLTLDANNVISNSSFTLSFRGAQNYVFDSASIATLTISNGLIGTGVLSSTNILDNTITASDISADSFDFTQLADSLTLDVNTVFSNSSFTLTFRGAQAYVFDSANISQLTLGCTGCISSTNILDGTILAADHSSDSLNFTELADSLTLDANTVISNSDFTLSFRGAQNYVFDSAQVSLLDISSKLFVSGTSTFDTGIEGLQSTGTGDLTITARADLRFSIDSNNNGSNAFRVFSNGNTTEVFRVNDSGSVGIGTTSPSSKLEIYDSAPNNSVDTARILNSGNGDALQIDQASTSTGFALNVNGRTSIFNSAQDGEISSWSNNNYTLPARLSNHSSVVVNGYLYAIGGRTGSTYYSTVYYTKLNSDGSAGPWTSAASTLPYKAGYNSSATTNGYLYVIGGYDGTQVYSTVYYAKLNSDGSLGNWSSSAYTLPGLRYTHSSLIANGYLYVIGGWDGSAYQSTVYYAKLNSDGSTGSWNSSPNTLPVRVGYQSTFAANGYLYLMGGDKGGPNYSSHVYYAQLNSNGTTGTWSSSAKTIPSLIGNSSAVVSNGYVYLIGGYNGSAYTSNTYYAKLGSTGDINNWSISTFTTPILSGNAAATVSNGYLYLIGGANASATSSNAYYTSTARVSVAGTLDLLGQTTSNLTDTNSNSGAGSTGGSIYAGNIYSNGTLEIAGNTQLWGGLGVNGGFTLGGSSSGDYGQLTLSGKGTTGNPATCGAGTIYFNTTDSTFQGCTSTNAWTKLDNSALTASNISADSFNFTELADSLTLDANTVLSNSSFTLTFRGAQNYVFDSASVSTLTISNGLIGTGVISSTNITDGTITSSDISADSFNFTELADSVALDANTVISNSSFTLSFRGAQNFVFDSAAVSTLTISNGLIGTGVISSTNITDGTIVNGDVSADSFDFTQLADSLTLDANTVISNSSFTLSFRGAQNYAFDSVSISMLNVTNCSGCTGTPAADSLDFTEFKDSLVLDAHTVISSSDFTLTFRGANAVVFDSANVSTLTLTNVLNGTGVINSTNILNGTIVSGDVSADTLDFTALADSLTLDANSVISNSSFTLTFRGSQNYVFDSGSITTLTITNGLIGTGVISSTNVLDGTLLAADHSADSLSFTEIADSNTLDANTVISNSSFTMTFRGAQNYVFDSGSISTLTITNGLIGTGVISSTNISDGTIVSGDISADSFDFTQLADSLTLDANSVISNSSFTLTFRGAQNYVFDSGSISTLTITNGLIGTGVISSTNITDGTILAADHSADSLNFTEFSDSLTLDANSVISNSSFTLTFRGAQNYVFDSASIATLTISNGLIGTGVISSTNILDNTITSSDISADSFNFTELADTLTLDAALVINQGTNTVTNNFFNTTGPAWSINSSSAVASGNAANLDIQQTNNSTSVDSVHISNSGTGDALQIDQRSTSSGFALNVNGRDSIFNSSQDGSIGSWSTSSTLPNSQQAHGIASANGYVYVVGGYNGSVVISTVYYAKIKADGTIGMWTTSTNYLPAARIFPGVTVANGYLYSVGGAASYSSGAGRSDVYYAKINSDGSISSWVSNPYTLPVSRDHAAVVNANGYMYYIAGEVSSNSGSSDIYYAKINTDGSLGSWTKNTTFLPDNRYGHSAAVANGYLYVLGGDNATNNTKSSVYYAQLNSDGSIGAWSSTVPLPDNRFTAAVVVANGYVYELGGANSSGSAQNTIYRSKLNSDGTVGTWATETYTLPASNKELTALYINGYLYSLGGSATANIYYSSVAKVRIAGSLDLLGQTTQDLSGANANSGSGSTGGSIYSGNIFSNGTLEIAGNTQLWGGLGVNGGITLGGSSATDYGQLTLSGKGSTGDPSSCGVGSIYFNTTDGVFKGCTAANTWTSFGSGAVAADSLNFTELADSLTLDANTVISNSSFTLTFRGAQNYVFDSGSISTLTLTNQLIGTGVINSGNIVDGTIVNGDVSSDTLDFTALADSLTLDANTVISNSSFTLTFRGAQNYVFDSGSISTLTLTNGLIGTGLISSTNILDNTITSSDISADSFNFTELADSLALDANTVISNSSFTMTFRGAQNYVFDSGSISTLTLTNGLIGSGVISSTNVLDGTLLGADISADALDFTALTDSLTLDANTVLSNSSFTMSFRGAQNYVFDSASINMLTVTNCSGCGAGVTADSLNFTDLSDSLVLDANTVISNSSFTLSFRGVQEYVFDSANIGKLTVTSCSGCGGTPAADSLDFTEFADSLALDATTLITLDGSENLVIELTSTNKFIVGDAASDGTPFVITDAGYVGVGTSAPVSPIDIFGNFAANGEALTLRRSGAGDVGISFQQNGSSAFGIVARSGSNGIAFVDNYYESDANNWESVRINRTGIGIYNTSPTSKLDIYDSSPSNTNDTVHILNSGTGDGLQIDQSRSSNAFALNANGRDSIFNSAQDGNIGTWTTNTYSLPQLNTQLTSVYTRGYVYLLGAGPANSDVYYAQMNENGSLGTWTASPNSLPQSRPNGSAISANGYLYYIGGSTTQSQVYYASVTTSGPIGSWTMATASIPQPSSQHASVYYNGYIYVLAGGNNNSNIYYAKTNSNGNITNWSTSTITLPTKRVDGAAVVTSNGYVYFLGGTDGTNPQSDVYYTKLNSDGTLNAWTQSAINSMPLPLSSHQAVYANGFIYVIGGLKGSGTGSTNSNIYYAKVNPDGSLGSGSSTPWTTTTNSMPNFRRDQASLYANGYLYNFGGANESNVATSQVFYGKLGKVMFYSSIDLDGGGLMGAGLRDCKGADSRLQYEESTGQFSCLDQNNTLGSNIARLRKQANEPITNNNTAQNDDELVFPVRANETWIYQFNITAAIPQTSDFKAAITAPAGATCSYGFSTPLVLNTSIATNTCGTSLSNTTTANSTQAIIVSGTVTTSTTTGNLQFQWAQNTANASTVVVLSGSSLVAWRVNGADLAEAYYSKDTSIQKGDLVSLDPTFTGGVRKSQAKADNKLLGVVSSSPGLVIGDTQGSENGPPVLVGLKGRVPVNVVKENGPIKPGDFLTASSTPGYAMKATKAGPIIGQALNDNDFSNPENTQVVVFLKDGYFSGEKVVDTITSLTNDDGTPRADLTADQLSSLILTHLNNQISTIDQDALSEISTDRVIAGLEVVTPSITAATAHLETLKPVKNTLNIALGKDGSVQILNSEGKDVITFDSLGNAHFAGTITADKIHANSIEGLEVLTNKLKALDASVSGLLTSTASSSAEASGSALASSPATAQTANLTGSDYLEAKDLKADSATFTSTLKALGTSFFADINLTGSFTQEGTLSIKDGNEISVIGYPSLGETIGGTLYLQKSPLSSGLDILAGKVRIDRDGNLVTLGDIKAKTIQSEELKIATERAKLTTEEKAKDPTVGNGQIAKNTKSAVIKNTNITKTSKVFFTMTSLTDKVLVVTTKVEGESFTVEITTNAPEDITFDYWIVN